jgi:catechol 2,3-dioxygenase
MLKVLSLGHLVLRVAQLDRAVAFYRDVLGLQLVARRLIGGTEMAFFRIGTNHHDLALVESPASSRVPASGGTGLVHFALKVGDNLGQLRAAREHLAARGIPIDRIVEHRVAQSLYLRDPDDHVLELYVDADPAIWRKDPATVAHSEPMLL